MRKIKLLLISLFIVFIPFFVIAVLDNYYSDRARTIIRQKVSNATSFIFSSGLKISAYDYNIEELLIYHKDDSQNVVSVLINTKVVNQIIEETSEKVSELINDGIIEAEIMKIEVPLGSLIFRSIFATCGPTITINPLPISSYSVDILTNNVPFGINNTLFQMNLKISIELETIIPLKSDIFTAETVFPIITQVINGSVPRYYYYGNDGNKYIPEDSS